MQPRTEEGRGERAPERRPLPVVRARGGSAAAALDARALEAELASRLEGEVRFDDGTRALYATDASNYRQVPIGVVVPRTIDDVIETVRICRAHGAPILSRGGGTSLAGQCCNVAVVIAWQKHLRGVLSIDPAERTARVLPGTILDELRAKAEEYHLTYGPDPATHDHCSLGGMLGNNSCGAHAQMAGPVSHNVVELDVLTYDGVRMTVGKTSEPELRRIIAGGGRRGEIYAALRDLRDRHGDEIRRRFPAIPRRVSGYNLNALLPEHGFDVARALVGTEGTCVTVLEAKLRLVHSPKHRVVVMLGYDDVYDAGDDAHEIAERFHPLALEGLDHVLVSNVTITAEQGEKAGTHLASSHAEFLPELPPGRGFLLVEVGGETDDEARARAREVAGWAGGRAPVRGVKVYADPRQQEHVWKIRESGLGATARVPGSPDTWPGWEDSAVPPERLGEYLRRLRALLERHRYGCALYGHFGQGCVHTRIDFDLTSARGIERYRAFVSEAVDLCLGMGGSLSGEHGDGQSRAEFLPRMFGEELTGAFRAFKRTWDPDGRMNPGKVVDPNPIDADLRLGAQYAPWRPETHFRFPDDGGQLHRAAERCVGVGKCRRDEGGTMCPSYRVTHEERHTTRGRAHLLFEMLKGDVIDGGWRDPHVKEALDLCLACKGCKGDCPVNVDLATYKAEFLSHYYQGRLRPRPAYAMGLVMAWAPLAMAAPGLVNALAGHAPTKELLQLLGGIDPRRRMPRFAPESFQAWARRRPAPPPRAGARRVLLWPDTFNNHFYPETARAAVEALEDLGFAVEVPRARLCCGRPLYDFGMLPTAKWLLRRTLRILHDDIEAGTPIVGLEPSCVSVFRDELRNLYPDSQLATKLRRQTFLFSEFVERYAKDAPLPRLEGRRAVVHGHCHHKSLFKLEDERALLERLGLELEVPETGCCGMAGSFGFEKGEKYDVSVKCGERVLLPRVRDASDRTLVVANGFSCREMIAQHTDREALHVAQVLRMAATQGPEGPRDGRPERGWVTHGLGVGPARRTAVRIGVAAAAAVVGAVLAQKLARSPRRRAYFLPFPSR